MISIVAERLCGSIPMMIVTSGVLPDLACEVGAEGTATSSFGQTPLQSFPAPCPGKPLESHANDAGGRPIWEHLTEYLDLILAGIKSWHQC